MEELPKLSAEAIAAVHAKEAAVVNGRYRPEKTDDIANDTWRWNALAMRLRIETNRANLGFQHLSTAYIGESVFVFVVESDTPVTLTDQAGLFPSDTLITQLRLIQK